VRASVKTNFLPQFVPPKLILAAAVCLARRGRFPPPAAARFLRTATMHLATLKIAQPFMDSLPANLQSPVRDERTVLPSLAGLLHLMDALPSHKWLAIVNDSRSTILGEFLRHAAGRVARRAPRASLQSVKRRLKLV
jgi:hypothetical protein